MESGQSTSPQVQTGGHVLFYLAQKVTPTDGFQLVEIDADRNGARQVADAV